MVSQGACGGTREGPGLKPIEEEALIQEPEGPAPFGVDAKVVLKNSEHSIDNPSVAEATMQSDRLCTR